MKVTLQCQRLSFRLNNICNNRKMFYYTICINVICIIKVKNTSLFFVIDFNSRNINFWLEHPRLLCYYPL